MWKKFGIFLGIVFLLSGLRLFDNGLLGVGRGGTFTVFNDNGTVAAVYTDEDIPLLDRFSSYTRLDVEGGEEELKSDLKALFAKVQFREAVEDIMIVYAYSPLISKYEIVHGKKVNVMAALKDGAIAYGCPLLLGSY